METRATKMVACENIRFSSLFAAEETTKMEGGELNHTEFKSLTVQNLTQTMSLTPLEQF